LINGILVIIASWYANHKYGFPLALFKVFWKPAAASFVMGAALFAANMIPGVNLFLLLLLGIFVYIVALIVFKGIAKDDLNLLTEALHLGKGRKKDEPTQSGSSNRLTEVKDQHS